MRSDAVRVPSTVFRSPGRLWSILVIRRFWVLRRCLRHIIVELTELEGTLSGVNNYCIAVKEQGDDIVFLRKIVKGGADKSYGIQVAKLAGVPAPVIDRAKELVEELSDADITARAKEIAQNGPGTQTRKKVAKPDEVDLQQMSIFDTVNEDDIIKEIMELEVNRMSPLDALNTLDKLQAKLKIGGCTSKKS